MLGHFVTLKESRSTIAVGCLVGVISSATQAVGLTLQRKSHVTEESRPSGGGHRTPVHKRELWRIGLILFLLSNVLGSSVQISTLPLVILSPLQAVGLVFNSICASLILSEPFTRYSVVGTILVSFGALLIATFGAVPEPQHNLNELLELLRESPFITWMISTFVVIGVIFLAIRFLDELPLNKYGYNLFTIKGIFYGIISGILSAHSLLMAKSAVELLVRGIRDHHMHDYFRWQTWVIVGAFLFFALSQLYILNCGLRLCSTSVLYPLVFCVYNITAILNGLIYFKQTSKLSGVQIVLVAVGTVLVLLGVLSLSWRLENTSSSGSGGGDSSSNNDHTHHRPQHHPSSSTGAKPQDSMNSDDERQPLLIDTSSFETPPEYTSFRSLSSGSGIPEPTSPFSANRQGNQFRVRTLSLEQAEILEQLRRNNGL